MVGTRYTIDFQNGKKKYADSLVKARKIAYAYLHRTKRKLPVVIYSPSGKMSGIAKMNPYGTGIEWMKITDKYGSMTSELFKDGTTAW